MENVVETAPEVVVLSDEDLIATIQAVSKRLGISLNSASEAKLASLNTEGLTGLLNSLQASLNEKLAAEEAEAISLFQSLIPRPPAPVAHEWTLFKVGPDQYEYSNGVTTTQMSWEHALAWSDRNGIDLESAVERS